MKKALIKRSFVLKLTSWSGKWFKKLCFAVLASVFVSLCMYSKGYSWTEGADFAEGKIGKPAQGLSGFDQAGAQTTFSKDLVVPSAKFYWPADYYGYLNGMKYLANLTEGSQIWYKASMYFESPWSWDCNPAVKIMQLQVAQAGGNHCGNHLGYVSIFAEAEGGIVYSNEIAGTQQYVSGHYFDLDTWQDIEIYVKFSTISPITRIWKKGVLIYENKTDPTLGSSTDYSDFMYTMSDWNGGSPQNQTQYVCNVVVTTDTPVNRDALGNPMISLPPGGNASLRPTANSAQYAAAENTQLTGQLTGTGPNGMPLVYSIVANGTLGKVVMKDPYTSAFTYTPHKNAVGTDTFTFTVSDGAATSIAATVTVNISNNPAESCGRGSSGKTNQ